MSEYVQVPYQQLSATSSMAESWHIYRWTLLLGIGGVVVGAIGPVLVAELAYPISIVAAWIAFGGFWISENTRSIPSKLDLGVENSMHISSSSFGFTGTWRKQATLDVLIKYHANGDREDEVVQFEFQEIVGTIELEITAKQTT
ncbi:hypothetical protein B0J14DRAFT_561358 [Halenospora varia]|nr:hypothetical protein B0J14DRAFT_561358 [Halenospora varia]